MSVLTRSRKTKTQNFCLPTGRWGKTTPNKGGVCWTCLPHINRTCLKRTLNQRSHFFLNGVISEKKKAYTTTTERKSFGELFWPKRNFPGRWWIQKPYKNQENHIYHRNLSSVAPFLLGQRKVLHWSRAVYAFLFPAFIFPEVVLSLNFREVLKKLRCPNRKIAIAAISPWPCTPCFFFSISILFLFSDFARFYYAFFLLFPRIFRVPRREKPLLFSEFLLFFSKKARVGGSGQIAINRTTWNRRALCEIAAESPLKVHLLKTRVEIATEIAVIRIAAISNR